MAGDEQQPDKQKRRAGELLAHQQELGEELLGASRAWVARVRPKGHVFFAGRHRHLVALTDRRLVAWHRSDRHAQRQGGATRSAPTPRPRSTCHSRRCGRAPSTREGRSSRCS